jgi:hypothetical protein
MGHESAIFLGEMNLLPLQDKLVALFEPHPTSAKTGRLPLALLVMMSIHFLQHWFV